LQQAVKQAVQTAVLDTTAEGTRRIPLEAEMVRELALSLTIVRPIKIPELHGGVSDKKKRDYIEKSDFSVVYKRGQLGVDKKDVWHTWALKDDKWNRVIVMGDAPQGARVVDGPMSAYKTIQQLGKGKLPKAELFEDTGAVDTRISLGGKTPRIAFERDASIKPTGERSAPLSEKAPRLSYYSPRISQRAPRISSHVKRLR
jgi:hypothetical protein